MHPVIEEICRAGSVVQYHALRRWQRVLRDEVQPMLDELDQRRAADQQAKAADPRKGAPR